MPSPLIPEILSRLFQSFRNKSFLAWSLEIAFLGGSRIPGPQLLTVKGLHLPAWCSHTEPCDSLLTALMLPPSEGHSRSGRLRPSICTFEPQVT